MNRKWMRPALAASVLAFAIAPEVEARLHARDLNIEVGIQYVIQGFKVDRRTLEEQRRIFELAVTNLNEGLANDPKDGEAWDYLGRAYGELDSAEQCGHAYEEAIARLGDKPKILKRAQDNRAFFFVKYYNGGLARYKEATEIMKVEDIANSTDPRAAEAKAKLALAEAGFRRALLIDKTRAIAYDNLAAMLVLQGKVAEAGSVVEQGLANTMPKEGEEYERLMKRKAR